MGNRLFLKNLLFIPNIVARVEVSRNKLKFKVEVENKFQIKSEKCEVNNNNMHCKRLNMIDNTECGKTPIVDTYHKVCAEHSAEREIDWRDYHHWNNAKELFQLGKINRAELKAIYRMEKRERAFYHQKYQLDIEYNHELFECTMQHELVTLTSHKWVQSADIGIITANKNVTAINVHMDRYFVPLMEEITQEYIANIITGVINYRKRINCQNRVVEEDWEEYITEEQRQKDERENLSSAMAYSLQEQQIKISPYLDVVGEKYTEHLQKAIELRRRLEDEKEQMEQWKHYKEIEMNQMETDDDSGLMSVGETMDESEEDYYINCDSDSGC